MAKLRDDDHSRKITLTADVSGYVEGMERAKKATEDLIATQRKAQVSKHIEIVTDTTARNTSITVDGLDISYWIACEPIVVSSTLDGITTVTVKLAAPKVTHTVIP